MYLQYVPMSLLSPVFSCDGDSFTQRTEIVLSVTPPILHTTISLLTTGSITQLETAILYMSSVALEELSEVRENNPDIIVREKC